VATAHVVGQRGSLPAEGAGGVQGHLRGQERHTICSSLQPASGNRLSQGRGLKHSLQLSKVDDGQYQAEDFLK